MVMDVIDAGKLRRCMAGGPEGSRENGTGGTRTLSFLFAKEMLYQIKLQPLKLHGACQSGHAVGARDGTRTRFFRFDRSVTLPFVFASIAAAGLEPATYSTGTSTRFPALRAPPVIGVTPGSRCIRNLPVGPSYVADFHGPGKVSSG